MDRGVAPMDAAAVAVAYSHPSFARAATVDERTARGLIGVEWDADECLTRNEYWFGESRFAGSTELSLDRWTARGLSQDDLKALQGETLSSLARRIDSASWYGDFAAAHASSMHHRGIELPVEFAPAKHLYAWFVQRLTARLNRAMVGQVADSLMPTDLRWVIPPPIPIFTSIPRALVQEAQLAFQGNASPEAFAAQFDSPDACVQFFSLYPVAARMITEQLQAWSDVQFEFYMRLASDASQIRSALGVTGSVYSIQWSAGDRHDSGRSVAILETDTGSKFSISQDQCSSSQSSLR